MKYEHTFAFGTKLTVTRIGWERDHRFDFAPREVWRVDIESSSAKYSGSIKSGCGATLEVEEAMATALGFLGAFLESYHTGGCAETRADDNSSLFPSWVADAIDSDEVDILYAELAYDEEGNSRW